MKKLMIAAAIVCAAVVANAAAANWKAGASKINDGKGDKAALFSGTAYIFDAGVTSQTALWTLIQAGSFDATKTAGYMNSATVTDGAFSNVAWQNGEQGESNAYNYYFVIVDSKDLAYFSNIKGSKPNASATTKSIAFGVQYDAEDPTALPNSAALPTTTLRAGAWVKSAGGGDVPEPTSAMLMLLGVAGLALRRKQK